MNKSRVASAVLLILVALPLDAQTPSPGTYSAAVYDVLEERGHLVPMRDGVELSADIYLPNSDDPAPAVLKYYPYRKDDILRPLVEPRVRYFASRGYVGILLDVRGTGGSGGSTKQMLRMQEWEDGYDAVEWIAVQPWCDGNVGMTGVSYGGYSAQLTAAQAPPHLKAIVPIYCGADQYQNGRPGGNLQTSIWTGLYDSIECGAASRGFGR